MRQARRANCRIGPRPKTDGRDVRMRMNQFDRRRTARSSPLSPTLVLEIFCYLAVFCYYSVSCYLADFCYIAVFVYLAVLCYQQLSVIMQFSVIKQFSVI
jgi:hypothetical protein